MRPVRESELSVYQKTVVEIPQPGNPVGTRTKGELDQIAKNLGTELKTDEEGRAYILTASLGYYFDTQGRVVQIDALTEIWNYVDEKLVWGVERRKFAYDSFGRLCKSEVSHSRNGALWHIMEQKQFIYENDAYRIVQPVVNGLVAPAHS